MAKVLLIGESSYMISDLIKSLNKLGHIVRTAKSNQEGKNVIDTSFDEFELIILDKEVQQVQGVTLMNQFIVQKKQLISPGYYKSVNGQHARLYCYLTKPDKASHYRAVQQIEL